MLPILAVIGVAAASFVSTSFDNFMLLLGFNADGRYSEGHVLFGYAVSTLGMVLLAFVAATAFGGVSTHLLGYLGLIPLSLGLFGIARLLGTRPATAPDRQDRPRGFLAVSGVMLANSGDTLAVFVSVFADTADGLEGWVVGTAVAIAVLYAVLARGLIERTGAVERLQRGTRVVLPFVLIGIGAYILANTPTDVVP